jgi:hypothetical protein
MTLVFLAELWVIHIIHNKLILPALPAFLIMGLLAVLITLIAVTLVFFRTDYYGYVLWLVQTYIRKFLSKLPFGRGNKG